MNDQLTLKFWGVRGSHPTPGAGTVKYGGNTACVEVRAGARTIILDAGTGIIPLGRDLVRRARADGRALEPVIFISHLHHDHTQGFPFFIPAYLPNARLHIFGPGASDDALARVLDSNQSPPTFPVGLREMAAVKNIRSLRETDAVAIGEEDVWVGAAGQNSGEVSVKIMHSYAHPGGVYVYRVEWRGRSIVYATDTEGYVGTDRKLVDFARGADILIHDAQYSSEHYNGQMTGFPSTQGYGHSTAEMACEVASAAGVGRLVLFHHEPAYGDETITAIEAGARAKFPNTIAAYEGLTLSTLIPTPLPPSTSLRTGAGRGKAVQYAQNG
jgi:phosphoribosyl 1,2-cyclic phosphodiesterase